MFHRLRPLVKQVKGKLGELLLQRGDGRLKLGYLLTEFEDG
jgi:hypothetical protein